MDNENSILQGGRNGSIEGEIIDLLKAGPLAAKALKSQIKANMKIEGKNKGFDKRYLRCLHSLRESGRITWMCIEGNKKKKHVRGYRILSKEERAEPRKLSIMLQELNSDEATVRLRGARSYAELATDGICVIYLPSALKTLKNMLIMAYGHEHAPKKKDGVVTYELLRALRGIMKTENDNKRIQTRNYIVNYFLETVKDIAINGEDISARKDAIYTLGDMGNRRALDWIFEFIKPKPKDKDKDAMIQSTFESLHVALGYALKRSPLAKECEDDIRSRLDRLLENGDPHIRERARKLIES